MNMAKFMGAFMGSIIVGIWAIAAFVHYILPDGLINQWYGFPLALTALFLVSAFSIICTYLITRND